MSDEGGDLDGFVFVPGNDTEIELERSQQQHRRRAPSISVQVDARTPTLAHAHAHTPLHSARTAAPPAQSRPAPAAAPARKRSIPPDVAAHPLTARFTLLPLRLGVGRTAFLLTRKRAEDLLLLGALVVGIVQLGYGWNEWALAGGK
jgi:hypothetical protein